MEGREGGVCRQTPGQSDRQADVPFTSGSRKGGVDWRTTNKPRADGDRVVNGECVVLEWVQMHS